MKHGNGRKKLENGVITHVRRLKKAAFERHTVLASVSYLGVLGLVFVLPVIAGAYLGSWLDNLSAGYSLRWTMSLIILGIVVGIMNVYFLLRTKE
ncbi:MAG: AtpZ/AtpI family protein [Pseudomonadota bacterium]